jgi:2-C-methyl-D-erythritol 4-phosphate cytidylyltransferase
MQTATCVVAAGQGTRLGREFSGTPKALVPVFGRPMLYYSLHALDLVSETGEVVVAAPPDAIHKFESLIHLWGFSRPVHVVAGGATRTRSVINALKAYAHSNLDRVLIHDAARACITDEMIQAVMKASQDGSAATLAQQVSDTLRQFSNGVITGEIDRNIIVALETPQIFPYAKLMELHATAGNDKLTDDTTLFTRAGEKVKLVFHEGSNLKITFPEDIAATEGILYLRGWQDASEGED